MELIDRKRYPLENAVRRAEIIATARRQLAQVGAAAFPGFIAPEALKQMQLEAMRGLPHAYRRDQQLGFNAKGRLAEQPSDALSAWRSPYKMWGLGADVLPADGAVHGIYGAPALIDLVRDILRLEGLYRVADPLVSVNVTYMSEGDQHGWHFDDNDFVVSLLLQMPERGGAFEFVPRFTSASTPEALEVLRGSSPKTRTLVVEPGTLLLFQGREALHRVSPVEGQSLRIMALLSYHTEPGFVFPRSVRLNSLGRDA